MKMEKVKPESEIYTSLIHVYGREVSFSLLTYTPPHNHPLNNHDFYILEKRRQVNRTSSRNKSRKYLIHRDNVQ
jgi:hypothetical protein